MRSGFRFNIAVPGRWQGGGDDEADACGKFVGQPGKCRGQLRVPELIEGIEEKPKGAGWRGPFKRLVKGVGQCIDV